MGQESTVAWIHYPRSREAPPFIVEVVGCFMGASDKIASSKYTHGSDRVLSFVRPELLRLGFQVEAGKKKADLIPVPVLFGDQGAPDKSFHADAYHKEKGVVVEIEAGRAYANNQFLKDIFQACVMHGVRELVIAVRQQYRDQKDYELIRSFLETLYASDRLKLPLDGLTLIGY